MGMQCTTNLSILIIQAYASFIFQCQEELKLKHMIVCNFTQEMQHCSLDYSQAHET